ncbi:E3 ubiquitin-protein ligase FANCL-like isoform X2 [Homarus americanus]|uniref:E3 ubiquitin-protein ligase FANCL-like isoform X2 n=1 Tax=Homarus americanus TaxID=6706 RepID=UPI001C487A70|nr:E3 ubiquitin-protein ligase FANCL-like isoform X2 [Homarus americanus]
MAVSEFSATFPLLCPSIFRKGVAHEVQLDTPHFPALKGMTLSTDIQLSCIVNSCRPQLLEEEKKCSTVLEYLLKFQKICSSIPSDEQKEEEEYLSLLNKSHFKCLLSHLEAIGWSKVTNVSSNFSTITFETRDEKERSHILMVNVKAGYPQEEPVVKADLPVELEFSWSPVEGLSCILTAWQELLASLQAFWDVLDELDEAVLVLDPPSPARRHTTRRILLRNHVSVQLTVSLVHPHSLPQCHLLGTSRLVDPLNIRLTEKYEEWDPERSIVRNLEAILGVSVVRSKTGGQAEEWSAECAVCYCLHIEESLPDLTCDHCSQAFHVQCLYEWLCGLTNSRQSMNVIFGECPYCTQLISCKVPA